MEWISNDFERQLRYKIAHYDYLDTFPKMANFGVNQSDFDDYVIEKQSVLDMEGNARKRYTLLALIFLLPFFVLSAFPAKAKTIEKYVSSSNREVYRSSKSVFCEVIRIINASENIKKVN